jgi:hypothetical protein
VALQRRARAERDDRRLVPDAGPHDLDALVDGLREHDGIGERRRVEGRVGAVQAPDVVAGLDPVGAERRGQVIDAARVGRGHRRGSSTI